MFCFRTIEGPIRSGKCLHFMVVVIAVFGIIFMMISGGWLYRKNRKEGRQRPAGDL